MTLLPGDGVVVEIAFSTTPDAAAPAWVDVTTYVLMEPGITITYGRGPEDGNIPATQCTLTLKNDDGRFTPERTGSPYHPNVKLRRRMRVTVQGSVRFTGFVDEWPVLWLSPEVSRVPIVATDRQHRVEKSDKLRSIVEEELLSDSPHAYFPLGETEGSTVAGDVSGQNVTSELSVVQVGSGGTIAFGAGTGPGTDGLTAPVFTRATQTTGKLLRATTGSRYGGTTAMTIEVAFSSTLTGSSSRMVHLYTPGGASVGVDIDDNFGERRVMVWFYTDTYEDPEGLGVGAGTMGGIVVNDGATHQVQVVFRNPTTSGTTVDLYLDGGLDRTVTVNLLPWKSTTLPVLNTLEVGGGVEAVDWGDTMFLTGTLSHVAVYPSALSAGAIGDHRTSMTTGFSGERSDQRVARLLGYAGVATADTTLDVGDTKGVEHYDITGMSPLEAAGKAVTAEAGLLFVGRDGKFRMHNRSRRAGQAAALTATASQVRPGTEFRLNDQGVVNDVTCKQPSSGYSYRAVDSASIADIEETRTQEVEVVTTRVSEVRDMAHWLLTLRSTPKSRTPTVSVDLLTADAIRATVLALDISSRVDVTGLPSQAPASSVQLVVEGYTETISATAWDITFNTSANPVPFWRLGNAGYSELGSTTRLAF